MSDQHLRQGIADLAARKPGATGRALLALLGEIEACRLCGATNVSGGDYEDSGLCQRCLYGWSTR